MKTYRVLSEGSRKFLLVGDDRLLGELLYPKWYSYHAVLHLENGGKYEIKALDAFGQNVQLREGERIVMESKTSWKGTTRINAGGKTYLLKMKSFWKYSFVVEDATDCEVAEIIPDFQWKSLNLNYEIRTGFEAPLPEELPLFLLYVVHTANYYMNALIVA